jgi:bifunctional non-homologous end joining protein LigD
MDSLRVGRRRVELSNTDKLLFPDDGISKGELIDYYRRVSRHLLRHAGNRPLTLHRFPDGIGKDGFYQQQKSDYFPGWIETCRTPRAGDPREKVEHVLCNNAATLVYLANQATITLHGWNSRAPRFDVPDQLVFDLDPPGDDFDAVRRAACRVAESMQSLGMNPYAMTTGSRGLHVVAPLRPGSNFEIVRGVARRMAARLAARYDDEMTVEQRKNKRRGRLYLDMSRNAYGQTRVLPYAVRALEGAPVATPLELDEIDDAGLAPRKWRMDNLFRRLAQKGDPWSDFKRRATGIQTAARALDRIARR